MCWRSIIRNLVLKPSGDGGSSEIGLRYTRQGDAGIRTVRDKLGSPIGNGGWGQYKKDHKLDRYPL